MARFILAVTLLLALGFSAAGKTSLRFAGSKVELLDSVEAAELNSRSDAYTSALTPFDLTIRLNKPGATEGDYLRRAAIAVHDWPASEVADLKRVLSLVEGSIVLKRLKLHLPSVIQIIKTDGSEEFGAEGYTRGARIMRNTGAGPASVHLVAHELFHVVSRANPALRDRVYAVFGFKPCEPISLDAATMGRSITNPDCPVVEHYIELPYNDQLVPFALVLYSNKDYQPEASLGEYVALGLVALNGTGRTKSTVITDEHFVFHDLNKMPAFFQKVGTNTQYLLHPEEISAEHFAMLVAGEEVREKIYIERVKAALRKP
jgi:hypothetical protein